MRVGGHHQDLTYWAPLGEDRYGRKTFSAPGIIKGRWEDKAEEFTATGGQSVVSKAVAAVDRDLAVGGYLALGNHLALADPELLTGVAQEIRVFQRAPDLRNVGVHRKAVM
jgi:hypothetical protein